MTTPIKIYKHAGYLIPMNQLSAEDIDRAKRRWTYRFYKESACSKCEFLVDRHNEEVCGQCPGYLGGRLLAKEVIIKGETYLSLPYGDKEAVRKFAKRLGEYKVINKHPKTPLSRPIKLLQQLRDYQIEARDAMIEHKCGVLDSPPRSGKTVIATSVVSKLGLKTLILAHQRDWLNNFVETFVGSDTQDAFTNAKPSQIVMAKTLQDFERADVALATFQQFMNPRGQKLLQKIRSMYPVLVVDEAHGVPAIQTSKILAQINAEYRFGLTGSPERKNEAEFVMVDKLIGPTVYRSKVEKLVPAFRPLFTKCKIEPKGTSQAAWPRYLTRLENDEKRTKLIVDLAVESIKAGHSVLIPVQRVQTVKRIVHLINDEFEDKVAVAFTGAVKDVQRKKLIEDARKYRIKAIVGVGKIVSTGLNIPRASMLIDNTPTNNRPGAIQRISRILTPYEGKPNPVYVRLLDETKACRSCFRSEWFSTISKEFKPHISKEDYAKIKAYIASGKVNHGLDEEDIRFGI